MNDSCQELMLVFDGKHQRFTSYMGAPWVPLSEDIAAAQRAATAAAATHGLCPVGADQITPSTIGPYAVLVFIWGGERGLLEGFLSEEPLPATEQAVVDAALAADRSSEGRGSRLREDHLLRTEPSHAIPLRRTGQCYDLLHQVRLAQFLWAERHIQAGSNRGQEICDVKWLAHQKGQAVLRDRLLGDIPTGEH